MKYLSKYFYCILMGVLLFLAVPVSGQQKNVGALRQDTLRAETQQDSDINLVDSLPEFPGGIAAMQNFILEHIHYPRSAELASVQGVVTVRAVVDTDGQLQYIHVEKSVRSDLDNAALEVVRLMPNWKPAYREGKPRRVMIEIPVRFRYHK